MGLRAMQRIKDPRSPDRILDHYHIEKELADRLRNSTRDERKSLYTAVYNELFQRVPDHPQLTRKRDGDASSREVAAKFRLVRR